MPNPSVRELLIQVLFVTEEKSFDLGSAGGHCGGSIWTLSKI
jgi:hypothetical protein